MPIVYDFDDAIFLPSVSEANRSISFLKYPGRWPQIIRLQHARDRRQRVSRALRAPLQPRGHRDSDVRRHRPLRAARRRARRGRERARSSAGSAARRRSRTSRRWPACSRDVAAAASVRAAGQRRRPAGAVSRRDASTNVPWSLADEVELFNTCDVGVYPLTDDEWSKGKCGFKAIQFMACGVPVVAAAVGVNREIIEDGVNGFLASTPDEWVEKLGRLLADPALRARLAAAGRRTIEERYSLHVNAPQLAAVLRGVGGADARLHAGAGESRRTSRSPASPASSRRAT